MSNISIKSIDPFQERPLWSVIIPHYNRDEFLYHALNSVLIQDRGADKMEIWVVDDCSTKGDPETIVKKVGKGRVNFFRQKKNVGQLRNFETCLNLSKGVLIHLLHCDDFVHRGFYEKLEAPLINNNTVGAAFTRHNSVDEENEVLTTSEEIIARPGILKDFMCAIAGKQMIQTPSIVVKREVYEKLGGFNKTLSWAEDWEMWVRIACNYKFYYHPEILASYRIHKASNTGNSLTTGRFIEDALACMKIYLNYLPVEKPVQRRIFKSAKQHILDYAIYVSRNLNREANDDKAALKILFKSFSLSDSVFLHHIIVKEILKVHVSKILKPFKNEKFISKYLKGESIV